MIKDILTKIVLVLVFGLGGFYGGIYYGTNKFNNMMDELYADYVLIKNDVDAFVEVSNPETIRHYVKELNKILDDITFLGKIVESGQVSSELLDSYFNEYEVKLENVKGRIKRLYSELLNLHKRLPVQPLVTAHSRTILPFVKFIVLLLGGCFTRMWDFTWRVSDCEELVGGWWSVSDSVKD